MYTLDIITYEGKNEKNTLTLDISRQLDKVNT